MLQLFDFVWFVKESKGHWSDVLLPLIMADRALGEKTLICKVMHSRRRLGGNRIIRKTRSFLKLLLHFCSDLS